MNNSKKKKIYITSWATTCTLITLLFIWIAQVATSTELPSKDEPLYFYSTQGGDDLTLTYRSAIRKAKKSVLLIIYHLNDPAIIKSLRAKAAEGVEVTILYDEKASPGLKKRVGKEIKMIAHKSAGLMHQKILVVDKHIVLAGSANMTPYSLRVHANLVTGIASAPLAHYISEIAEADAWQVKRGKEHEGKTFVVGKQKVEFWALPAGENGVNRITKLIHSAKKSIRVAMFTWTRQDFAQAIIQAKLRGVDVQVAIDQGTSKGASSKIVKLIASKGIPIYHNHTGSLLHHKFLYVDNTTLVNGSANWTKAAFTQNKDCFLVIHDLSQQQQRKVQSVWNAIVRDAVYHADP